MSSLKNWKGCFLCLLGIAIFFAITLGLMSIGSDMYCSNVCWYWFMQFWCVLSWLVLVLKCIGMEKNIFCIPSEKHSSFRERVVFVTARPSCHWVPSVLNAFCCSAAACTVSIPSHTPSSRIPVSSTEWSKWHNWVFCFWTTWGIKLEDNSGSKGYWKIKQKKG